jgi:hypothetical protein
MVERSKKIQAELVLCAACITTSNTDAVLFSSGKLSFLHGFSFMRWTDSAADLLFVSMQALNSRSVFTTESRPSRAVRNN